MPEQFVVDAFCSGPFTGNPAAVVPLEAWLPESTMQAIAAQNNLSETAFFVDGDIPELRWFTPAAEIDLCGHATLATAHVLFSELKDSRESVEFQSKGGPLRVGRAADGYALDFPEIELAPLSLDEPEVAAAAAAIGTECVGAFRADWLIVELVDADAVRGLRPNIDAIGALPGGDLVVTAPGSGEFDICSRAFAPGVGIPEDPVTGSVHCALVPFWSKRLGKPALLCEQASERGGVLTGQWRAADSRVDLIGACRTFLRGEIDVSG